MSEYMLHGVLNIPLEMWHDSPIFKIQQQARCVEASKVIYEKDARIKELEQKLAEVTEWRPIDSAPKDGTPILVRLGNTGNIVQATYCNGIFIDCWCARISEAYNPTHWLPLPASNEVKA